MSAGSSSGVRLYICKIMDVADDISADDSHKALREVLSPRCLRKIAQFKKAPPINDTVTAELLLRHVLTHRYGFGEQPLSIEEEPDGKPYLADHPEIHFSLSHSGEYALCAIGSSRVGADLQVKRRITADIASRFFSEKERAYLADSQHPEDAFFDIWVLKESYIKYTGKGLAQGLSAFSVVPFGTVTDAKWSGLALRTRHLAFGEYAIGVCASDTIEDRVEEVILKEATDRL